MLASELAWSEVAREENTEPLEKHYLYYPEGILDVF
jgi:hypothetical protein